jgi:RNA polymerase sigma factor (sigma-70 family)
MKPCFADNPLAIVGLLVQRLLPATSWPMSTPNTPEPSTIADQSRWFAEEVHVHDSVLRSYLRRSFPHAGGEVDDVVQESYLRVWKARATQPIASAKNFLFTVARRLAIDGLRRSRISPVVALPELDALPVMDGRPGVAETACTNDELALLAQAFHALPNRCREVMVLRQIHGASQKEIARRLGVSELTVQTHVVHGLRRIEAFFRKFGASRDHV